jgi:hypothetical protein
MLLTIFLKRTPKTILYLLYLYLKDIGSTLFEFFTGSFIINQGKNVIVCLNDIVTDLNLIAGFNATLIIMMSHFSGSSFPQKADGSTDLFLRSVLKGFICKIFSRKTKVLYIDMNATAKGLLLNYNLLLAK